MRRGGLIRPVTTGDWLLLGRSDSSVTPRAKASWEIEFDTSYFSRYNEVGDAWVPVDGRTAVQCEEANQNMVKDLIEKFHKMELKARYEVHVVDDKYEDSDSCDIEHYSGGTDVFG